MDIFRERGSMGDDVGNVPGTIFFFISFLLFAFFFIVIKKSVRKEVIRLSWKKKITQKQTNELEIAFIQC